LTHDKHIISRCSSDIVSYLYFTILNNKGVHMAGSIHNLLQMLLLQLKIPDSNLLSYPTKSPLQPLNVLLSVYQLTHHSH
jgi:hypothetical protein